jgi:hypothetical protein
MSAKLFLGHRVRRLRREHELSQTDMAQCLDISPSYLNHLERNQLGGDSRCVFGSEWTWIGHNEQEVLACRPG